MIIDKYLETHKEQYNYCEVVIFPDGTIEDARPSHCEMLLKITGEDREIIYDKMPINAGPVAWLVDYTNCCSIWYNMGMLPENVTKEQENTIEILKKAGQISKEFVATKPLEMKICGINKLKSNQNEKNEEIRKYSYDEYEK